VERQWEEKKYAARRRARDRAAGAAAAPKEERGGPGLRCTAARALGAAAVLAVCWVLTVTGDPLAARAAEVYHTLLRAPLAQTAAVWRQAADRLQLAQVFGQMEDTVLVFAGVPGQQEQSRPGETLRSGAAAEESTPAADAMGQGGWLPWSKAQTPRTLPDGVTAERPLLSARAAAPANGILSCGFGWRKHPITGQDDFHTGIDIAAEAGSPVCAAYPGRVAETGSSAIYGNTIRIDHGGGLVTAYCHCQSILVKAGEQLRAGERIATVGSTGISTGPHLHFELLVGGLAADPLCAFDAL